MNNGINGYYMPSNNNMYQVNTGKKKSRKWILLIPFCIFLVILVGIFLKDSSTAKKISYKFDNLKNTASFFLEDSNKKYALFNENGKQLTDFEFTKVESFYGGVALVKNEDGKSAIIKENGSYLIDFTEDEIESYQSLFLVKGESQQLINYEGKKVLEGDLTVSTFPDSSLFIVTIDDKATVLTYRGEVLDTLKKGNYSKSQKVVNGISSLVADNKTYVYDIDSLKKIFETSGTYCITDNAFGQTVLTTCSSDDSEQLYKVIDKDNEKYTISKSFCSAIEIMKDGNPICRSMNPSIYHFINDGNSLGDELVVGFHSRKDYVTKNGTGLIFYVDSKERYRVPCAELSEMTESGYIVKNYTYGECSNTSQGYSFYSMTGEKISDTFYHVNNWNSNSQAVIESRLNEAYLVNDKLKKVSANYKAIYIFDSLYIGIDASGSYHLFDKNHNILESNFKSYKNIERSSDKGNCLALLYGDRMILYNSTAGKKVGENSGSNVKLYEHYYMIDNGYYSYITGERFYEKE